MIGSNLAKQLSKLQHDVTIVDNLWRGSRQNLRLFFDEEFLEDRLVVGDLTNPAVCDRVTEGFDTVFHLADVVAGIGYVFGNQFSIWQTNVLINSNMLSSAVKNRCTHYIYVGTACSYPAHLTASIGSGELLREDQAYPANPESAYGWSKLMGEYALQLAYEEGLIDGTILRLHNVYGYPTVFRGDKAQVIPSLARKVASFPTEDLTVWGSGNQRRSFIHVRDVVTALVSGMNLGVNQGPIQIGPSESTSIREIAESLIKISGKPITPTFDLNKPEGDGDRVGDTSRAHSILGWQQQVPLGEGLLETYEWIAAEVAKSQLI